MNKIIKGVLLGFIAEQTQVPQGDVVFWDLQEEFIAKVGNQRGLAFTTPKGATHVIYHVAMNCYVIMDANTETKINIALTRQLQERIHTAIEEADRMPVILICYDHTNPKLRETMEKIVRPQLQSLLQGVARIATEFSDDELSSNIGEPSEILVERQVEGIAGAILCITSEYLRSGRFPFQVRMFAQFLPGKVFPVVYENGLDLPPTLAILERDDSFDFARLNRTIRHWLS